jgi:ankyrin repeat protein
LHAHGVSRDDISYCLFHKLDVRHEEGIRWFLDHGADLARRHPREGETALHWAIKRSNSAPVIGWLLERGADPNARTRDGRTAYPTIRATTPLDLAERLGRMEVAALLRRHGAERSAPDAATAATDELVFACARADEATARRLLRADPGLLARLPAEDRDLPAHVAQQNERAAVEVMLAVGFSPDVHGWMNLTPLHWAACRGNPALIRALLARGARVEDLGRDFGTPVHTALTCRWQRGGDYAGAVTALVEGGVPLPPEVAPTGDAALDAAVARLRPRAAGD